MHRRLASHIFILGITCLLSACGFQLRGTGDHGTVVPDSWKSMHLVTGNPNGEFSRAVQALFAANGVQWLDREQANYILTLGPERFKQRNLSLNAEARAAEFELTMSSRFSVNDADSKEAMPPTDASVVRQMENDPRNVVGKAEEVRILKSEMRTELAQQIMRRIGFYAASTESE
jgi:LPS-assembly lipoprotein